MKHNQHILNSRYLSSKKYFTINNIIIITITVVVILGFLHITQLVLSADVLQFTKIAIHPSDRELSGDNADSESAQGIAFDGFHWFYSNSSKIFRLSRNFRNCDKKLNLANYKFGTTKCSHVGGIDFYGGEIYAALEKCSDGKARVVVLDTDLNFKRSAVLAELKHSFPWVAVNPIDKDFFYTIAHNGRQLLAFRKSFPDGASLTSVKTIYFQNHPQDVLGHFWKQGGAFAKNGLFFRTVDDSKDENSQHTGIWIYELDYPITNKSLARRVGFINIRYDPDQWVPFLCLFDQCKRNYELEDLDISSISGGETAGDVHILLLSNEGDEDDISVYHYSSGDYDRDGIKDIHDNCIWISNTGQEDLDQDGVGITCDEDEVGNILIPAITLPLQ